MYPYLTTLVVFTVIIFALFLVRQVRKRAHLETGQNEPLNQGGELTISLIVAVVVSLAATTLKPNLAETLLSTTIGRYLCYSLIVILAALIIYSLVVWLLKTRLPLLDRVLPTVFIIVLLPTLLLFFAEVRINHWSTLDDPTSQLLDSVVTEIHNGTSKIYSGIDNSGSHDPAQVWESDMATQDPACTGAIKSKERLQYAPVRQIPLFGVPETIKQPDDDGIYRSIIMYEFQDCWAVVQGKFDGLPPTGFKKMSLSVLNTFATKKKAYKRWLR